MLLTHAPMGHYTGLVQLGREGMGAIGMSLYVQPRVRVEAVNVAQRDEYTETVAFIVRGPARSRLWLPDIDAWDDRLPSLIASVDAAWIDGTFGADGELQRPMAEVPHPRIAEAPRWDADPSLSNVEPW